VRICRLQYTITTDTHQQRPDLLVLLQLFLAAVFFRSMPTLLVLHYLIQAIDFPLHDTTRHKTTQHKVRYHTESSRQQAAWQGRVVHVHCRKRTQAMQG
jgi:hypothetical protein